MHLLHTRYMLGIVRSLHGSVRFSAVCCTVLIRHNTSLYLLLIRLLYGLIRYISVLYVIYPFIIRYILSNLGTFGTVYERI